MAPRERVRGEMGNGTNIAGGSVGVEPIYCQSMSNKRQEPWIRSLGITVPPGYLVKAHIHEWPQLVFAVHGVISVTAGAEDWVVPPMRALWIDAGVEHTLRMRGRVEMRTLYFRPDRAPTMVSPCCVIEVAPLLRELIVSIVATGVLYGSLPGARARLRLLIDLLLVIPERPLVLPMPTDPRARRVVDRVTANIEAADTLPDLARGSGASARTIGRTFLAQTGMTFGRWRQHARFHEAIRLLGEGVPVTTVALRVGYRSPSAFIAAFRSSLGKTPAEYFHKSK